MLLSIIAGIAPNWFILYIKKLPTQCYTVKVVVLSCKIVFALSCLVQIIYCNKNMMIMQIVAYFVISKSLFFVVRMNKNVTFFDKPDNRIKKDELNELIDHYLIMK